MKKYTSVSEFLSSQPKRNRILLSELRDLIKKSAPQAEEVISYNMPAYKFHGMLLYFAGYENHIGFYTGGPSIGKVFKDELIKYKTSKGTIQFPLDQPLPSILIKKIVKYRVNENLDRSKLKKSK